MDLSFIIVNWNTKDLLKPCIKSIYQTVRDHAFEVWVVDNGSVDGSVEMLRQTFPEVNIIENRKNTGFAHANNQALRNISGRYAILLNSDTELTKGAIETLVRFMDKKKEVGICGGQLLNADGSRQNSIANIPGMATELLNKSLLRLFFPKTYPGKEQRFSAPVEVDSVIGACMAVRKEAIDAVGFLDESYFFFLEETDWCVSMKKNGWKVFHHPNALIYHHQGRSAGRTRVAARVEYWRSRYIFLNKHYGPLYVSILRTGLFIKLSLNVILTFFLSAVTLFINRSFREKLWIYGNILLWHIRGLPSGYGLQGEAR